MEPDRSLSYRQSPILHPSLSQTYPVQTLTLFSARFILIISSHFLLYLLSCFNFLGFLQFCMHFLIFVCVMVVRGASSGLEQPGREADDQSISSAEVRNVCSYICTLPHDFMPCKGNFTFTLPCVLHG